MNEIERDSSEDAPKKQSSSYCKACDLKFHRFDSLKNHTRARHPQIYNKFIEFMEKHAPDKKPYNCGICKFKSVINRYSSLQIHVRENHF